MTILLDDITDAEKLYPFGQVKSIAHIRLGMLTILEKWQRHFKHVALLSETPAPAGKVHRYPAAFIPSTESFKLIARGHPHHDDGFVILQNASDIIKYNDWALRQDFELLTENCASQAIPEVIQATGKDNIFLEAGARIEHCFINAETGPVYISKDAHLMDGAMLRGPLFIGKKSVVKMGARIYGGTTVGPYCMVGGEIKNSVLTAYSNKAHDGYLGDSVIGEWCNLGAGTSNSNLKNTAGEILLYIPVFQDPVVAGTKCGLIMGDYSRSAINTSFNTGTVVGISCNIFGDPPGKYVPDFSWGREKYLFEKVIRDIDNWKKLKGFEIMENETASLKKLYFKS